MQLYGHGSSSSENCANGECGVISAMVPNTPKIAPISIPTTMSLRPPPARDSEEARRASQERRDHELALSLRDREPTPRLLPTRPG